MRVNRATQSRHTPVQSRTSSPARTAYSSKVTPAATGSNPVGQMVSSSALVKMRYAPSRFAPSRYAPARYAPARFARSNEMEPLRFPGLSPMACPPLATSVSGVFRGNGEGATQGATQGAIFSKKGPFPAFKRRNGNPATGNGLRLETKGPAHDWTGLLVPRTGFEPVLPERLSRHPRLREFSPRSLQSKASPAGGNTPSNQGARVGGHFGSSIEVGTREHPHTPKRVGVNRFVEL